MAPPDFNPAHENESVLNDAGSHGWLKAMRAAMAVPAGDSSGQVTEPCEVERRLNILLSRPIRREVACDEPEVERASSELFEGGFAAPAPERKRTKNRRSFGVGVALATHVAAAGLGAMVCLAVIWRTNALAPADTGHAPPAAATASIRPARAELVVARREVMTLARTLPGPVAVTKPKSVPAPQMLEPAAIPAMTRTMPVQLLQPERVAFVPLVLRMRRSMPVTWTLHQDLDLKQEFPAVPDNPKEIASKVPPQAPRASAVPARGPRRPPAKPKVAEIMKPTVESEMVRIDAGTWMLGDSLDGQKDAVLHPVSLSAFWMARREVTLELWERVAQWGRSHGYGDLPPGMGKMQDHPVYGVTWTEALKWCNARSEMEGLAPCYFQDQARQKVFRSGTAELSNRCVNWEAGGYRLPTEAEWEAAARGRLAGRRFPWGDEITHEMANYSSLATAAYDRNKLRGSPSQFLGSLPYTSPAGSFRPNGFGLYDMAGNVSEWCWDFYDKFYGIPALASAGSIPPVVHDPVGPDTGSSCVVRGGSWRHDAGDARCASRFDLPSEVPSPHVGFRLVRRH